MYQKKLSEEMPEAPLLLPAARPVHCRTSTAIPRCQSNLNRDRLRPMFRAGPQLAERMSELWKVCRFPRQM